jgi:hypothetical protein
MFAFFTSIAKLRLFTLGRAYIFRDKCYQLRESTTELIMNWGRRVQDHDRI